MNSPEPKLAETITLRVPLDDANTLVDVLLSFVSIGTLVTLVDLLGDAVADLVGHDFDGAHE